MSKYSNYNIIYRLQKWMDTVAGQTFLNYAYSWGASVVILGALFKLTHLPGANIMLFIGMGTEVCVFFISAFDRPFDKTADGREMPTRLTEEFLATGKVSYGASDEGTVSPSPQQQVSEASVQSAKPHSHEASQPAGQSVAATVGAPSSQEPIIIFAGGGNTGGGSADSNNTGGSNAGVGNASNGKAGGNTSVGNGANANVSQSVQQSTARPSTVQPQPSATAAQPAYVPQMSPEEAEKLNEAQGHYVDELNALVETLQKVNEQSTRLTRDSEEMENLNRTLTGISKIYEMQLKGASQQVGTIDQINERTRKMAEQIDQLNHIYARMIEAMTVNMHVAAPGSQVNDKQ